MITRTPELAKELTAIMKGKGLSMHELALEAKVKYPLVSRMFHPERSGRVSKERASAVIEALTGDLQQQLKLFSLAGIDIYTFKDSEALFKLL